MHQVRQDEFVNQRGLLQEEKSWLWGIWMAGSALGATNKEWTDTFKFMQPVNVAIPRGQTTANASHLL
jgi:hypothetical protein